MQLTQKPFYCTVCGVSPPTHTLQSHGSTISASLTKEIRDSTAVIVGEEKSGWKERQTEKRKVTISFWTCKSVLLATEKSMRKPARDGQNANSTSMGWRKIRGGKRTFFVFVHTNCKFVQRNLLITIAIRCQGSQEAQRYPIAPRGIADRSLQILLVKRITPWSKAAPSPLSAPFFIPPLVYALTTCLPRAI